MNNAISQGNPASPIWIVGEAPEEVEVATRTPFSGPSGYLLDQLLTEVGIRRSECFLTNVCHEKPPYDLKKRGPSIEQWFRNKTAARKEGVPEMLGRYPLAPVVSGIGLLHSLVDDHHPNFIIALGNTPLWALTGEWGILKWRGSHLRAIASAPDTSRVRVLPTVHPAAVLREWSLRNLAAQDLRRARRLISTSDAAYDAPAWRFTIRPSFQDVMEQIAWLRNEMSAHSALKLACDIETRNRQIECFGMAWSSADAICIPFLGRPGSGGYWHPTEEAAIVVALRELLTDPRCHCIWQNGAYDLQYFAAQYGFLPNASDDTMLMQHTAFPGMRKGLDFLSSLYCRYHRYWKDDGKEWAFTHDDDQHWQYNCEDCVRTFEIQGVLSDVLRSLGLSEQYKFQMGSLFPIVLRMMIRGIQVDERRRRQLIIELKTFIVDALAWLGHVTNQPGLNPNSPKQMTEYFYGKLGLPPITNRKTGSPTVDDEAMLKIERRNPMLRPLLQSIRDIRSARTALANVLEAQLSPDGRARCTYNVAGTETFRLSSSEDAFGDGLNLQNITIGDEE